MVSGVPPVNILLWYWGRETSKYTLDLLHALRTIPNLNVVLSCSRGSDLHIAARQLPDLPIEPVTTYIGHKQNWRGRISTLAGIAALPWTMWRFRRTLRKYDIDVALCSQGAIWDMVTFPLLRRGNLRFLQVAHEIMSHAGEGYPLRDRIAQHQVAMADGIIVLSEEMRRLITDRLQWPAERCWKMQHGAFHFGTQPFEAAIHPRGKRPIRLLFFGRISPYKGFDRLFAALQILRDAGVAFHLTIAGAGNLEPYRQHMPTSDIEVRNYWLDDAEIGDALRDSDLVVLPYEISTQSGVAGGAYAAGRPVVATPVGGLVEQVLPMTGVLADNMSAEAYAAALLKLINDPELFDRCAAGALHYAQTALDWHHCARVLNEAIEQVCAMPRKSSTM